MSAIYLVEGPVGSGKSTFAERLSLQISAPHFNLDSWMANLFRPDRPSAGVIEWYVEREERCIEQIWDVAKRILDADCDVILKVGLVQSSSRHSMYARLRQRNLKRGATFSMEVPDEVFEMASNMWEELDDVECREQSIEFIET